MTEYCVLHVDSGHFVLGESKEEIVDKVYEVQGSPHTKIEYRDRKLGPFLMRGGWKKSTVTWSEEFSDKEAEKDMKRYLWDKLPTMGYRVYMRFNSFVGLILPDPLDSWR